MEKKLDSVQSLSNDKIDQSKVVEIPQSVAEIAPSVHIDAIDKSFLKILVERKYVRFVYVFCFVWFIFF